MATLFPTKKTIIVLIITLCLLCLSGCALFHTESPFDYPGSTWISKDPYVYLHVVDEHEYNAECYVIVDGERVDAGFYTNGKIGSIIKSNRCENTDDIVFHFEFKCKNNQLQLRLLTGYNNAYSIIVLDRIQ